jgi:hypothetical protein
MAFEQPQPNFLSSNNPNKNIFDLATNQYPNNSSHRQILISSQSRHHLPKIYNLQYRPHPMHSMHINYSTMDYHSQKIVKTDNNNNRIIVSRYPITCTMISNTIVCKKKLTDTWFISQENCIHNTLELYSDSISNITPIGNLTQKQLFLFSIKIPETLNTTAHNKLKQE